MQPARSYRIRMYTTKNGQLKVPVKLTMEQYQNNLKEILDQMMNALKARKDEFSGLYQVQFGE